MKWLVFIGCMFAGIVFTFVVGVAEGNVPSIIVGVICLVVGIIALILIIKSYIKDKEYQNYQKFLKATAPQQSHPVSNHTLKIPQKTIFIDTLEDCLNNVCKTLNIEETISKVFSLYTKNIITEFRELSEADFALAYKSMFQKDQKGLFIHVFDENGNFNYLAYAASSFYGFLCKNGYDEDLCAEAYDYVVETGALELTVRHMQRNMRYKIVPNKSSV